MKSKLFGRPFLISLILLFFAATIYLLTRLPITDRVSAIDPSDFPSIIQYSQGRVSSIMDKYNIPCFGFAMVNDQEVLSSYVMGFSHPDKDEKASLNTLFRACSISKIFTALEIMKLYEERLVDIDLPISVYLPELNVNSRFREQDPITIRKILAHRSGLPRNGCLQPWHWDESPDILESVVGSMNCSYMAYPPGYRYKYSNVAFDILGRIVEKKRKVLFQDHMDLEVLGKIGMDSSTFLPESDDLENIARGFRTSKNKRIPYETFNNIQMASGNLHSTIPDMCNFLSFIFRDCIIENRPFIKEETLKMMFQPQYSWPGDPHENGLAWRTDTHRLSELAVFHHGICLGTQSLVLLLPDRKLGVALFCTSSSINDSALVNFGFEILTLLVKARDDIKLGPGSDQVIPPSKEELPEKGLFTGKYCFEEEFFDVFLDSDDLRIRIGESEIDLLHLEGNRFALSGSGNEFERYGKLECRFFLDQMEDDWVAHIFREGVYLGRADKCAVLSESLEKWEKLEGKYEAYPRFFSRFTEDRKVGGAEIILRDDILYLPSHRAFLKPLSDTELIIQGGLFDGETILYDPQSGYLTWQDVVYHPLKN